jgi:DEAD/DEAH box helicase domain-containing protein
VYRNKDILDVVDLDTAPWEREATGLWLDVSKPILDLMHAKGFDPAAAIHAAEHAFLNRFAMAADLQTECKAPEKEYKATESRRKRPARCVQCLSCVNSRLRLLQSDFLRRAW